MSWIRSGSRLLYMMPLTNTIGKKIEFQNSKMSPHILLFSDVFRPEEVFASLQSSAKHLPVDEVEMLNFAIYPGNETILNLRTTKRLIFHGFNNRYTVRSKKTRVINALDLGKVL